MKALMVGLWFALLTSGPVSAQDYLGVHLDTVRDNHLRNHQIESQKMKARQQRQATAALSRDSQAPSLVERQAAWSQNKAEYRRRLLRDGQARADRWLDDRAKMPSDPSNPTRTSRSRTACEKVRYVSRPVPGFGGAPMTLRREAVCSK